ncbi:ABC transporter substrate-binding protein [Breznakiella homolactica]|uniref:Sugar ABC transporter substrate-binding protein n=1 Tax=Breznakiella homolactica TaxID=2798577 RepID=A0A7T7XPN1_9SPIR|nr:sugar ABC transporter substrate-binding protein [Breznakiella homolactica]QQO10163.1 sugar ABC transporter substrate-binding protein [Breznakiella homolactica]
MKKRPLWLLCGMLCIVSLLSCGNNKKADTDGKITLTIASAMVTEDPEGGLEQALADEYMRLNPNVTIKFISTPAPEISKRMVTLAASNDLPDMFFVPNDFMPQLYTMDIVADLEGLLGKEWLDGYNQNLLRDAKINGKMMTIPWYASPYAVIYRLDWFQELGLAIPETWDQFIEVAKKMTRDTNGDNRTDKWAFSMVGTRNNSGEQRFVLISKSFGADEIYQGAGGKWVSDISTPAFKNGLRLFTELYTKHGVVPPGPVEVDYAGSMTLFTTEQTGMILSGPHSLGFITKQNPSLDGKLGSFVIPRDKEHISISGIGGYTITKTSQHQDVAADYMKFITNRQNAIDFGRKTGRMPTRTDAASDPFFSSPLFSGFLEAMDYCVEMETFPAYPALLDAIGEAYSTILAGSETLDSAYSKLTTKTTRILEENN